MASTGITDKGEFMALQVTFLEKVFSPAAERAISKLAAGESYEEAAAELNRDKETVKSYAAVFRQTMQAKSTLEAVAKAVARGVISIKEVDGKTLLACGLIALTSFNSDFVMAKNTRKAKTERREDADTPPSESLEILFGRGGQADFRSVVPGGFCDRAVR